MSARCSTCDAAIVWAKTVNGKAIPLDAEPNRDGNICLDGDIAVVVGKRDLFSPSEEVEGPRYVSHFATCPSAGEHRKSRR